ncbi:hypothetical protein LTR08_004553 [Meristemomyces frigidus]|nr:hypothetical protein LTR08_004553 [Meristemomyces frigidus]
MLAVTECQIGRPGIVAAAVNNPVVDWIDIDNDDDSSIVPPSLRSTMNASDDLSSQLCQLRKGMFLKPEHYFDPFASPLLFFRSAGQDLPYTQPAAPQDELELLAFLEREDFHREQLILSKISNVQPIKEFAAAVWKEDKAARKISNRYPSLALRLRLPPFDISAGAASPLKGQASELTQRLRKSYLQQAVAAGFGRKVLLDDELDQLNDEEKMERKARDAEIRKKAKLTQYEGLGLWDASEEGRNRAMNMVRWLRETLK